MLFRNRRPLLVGICGRSGAGKTYVLDLLSDRLGERVCILSQDHYYKPLEVQEKDIRGQVNFDLPTAIDEKRFTRDLNRLIKQEAIQVKEYTFNNPARSPRTIELQPRPVIIVEGLFIFHSSAIRNLLSLKVFIETDETTALNRRLERDLLERAYSEEMIRYQWENHVLPAYKQFVFPYKDSADLLIRNNAETVPDLEPLFDLIAGRLEAGRQQLLNPDKRT